MQQKNSAGTFFTDMQSTLKDMMGAVPTAMPFDMKAAMETQRKNFQAFTEANHRAMSGWQALAQRQTEMFSQFVQDNSGRASEALAEMTPEGKIAKQTELMKSACQQLIANTQELVQMMTDCTKDAAELINQRVMAGMSEMKVSAKKS